MKFKIGQRFTHPKLPHIVIERVDEVHFKTISDSDDPESEGRLFKPQLKSKGWDSWVLLEASNVESILERYEQDHVSFL
jgi:hypothetical protein